MIIQLYTINNIISYGYKRNYLSSKTIHGNPQIRTCTLLAEL